MLAFILLLTIAINTNPKLIAKTVNNKIFGALNIRREIKYKIATIPIEAKSNGLSSRFETSMSEKIPKITPKTTKIPTMDMKTKENSAHLNAYISLFTTRSIKKYSVGGNIKKGLNIVEIILAI